MHKMLNRGFTLIELLVVIAIIGILAAVVLGSLNDARDNANDASAQTSVNNTRNVAEVFYSEQGFTYGSDDQEITLNDATITTSTDSVCEDADVTNLMLAAANQTRQSANCFADDDEYAIEIQLRTDATNNYYCIDSSGFAGTTDGPTIGATDMVCGS